MKRLTVMDLDSMIYLIAYNNKDAGLHSVVEQNTREYIDHILTETHAEAYAGFYQKFGHKGYRYEFFPEYKSKRPPKPDYIKEFGPTIMEVFDSYKGIVGLDVIESDDALSIFNTKYSKEYYITYARIDKDLKCLPGKHYNYKTSQRATISVKEAKFFAACQVLAGDSGDGIPGVPGIGEKKSKDFVEAFPTVAQAYKAACKVKKVTSWIRSFYRDYHCINLLDTIEELKKFTDREEVDIFVIDEMEYEMESPIEDLEDGEW